MNKQILVTGGAGYIGSQCVIALLEKGCDVVIFDNLSTGNAETINTLQELGKVSFYRGDLTNPEDLNALFKQIHPDVVMHFAAFSQVGESVQNPKKYYQNNPRK